MPTKDLPSPYIAQGEWGLPPYVDIGDEFIEAQYLDDMLLITTERVSIAFTLEETSIVRLKLDYADVRFEHLTERRSHPLILDILLGLIPTYRPIHGDNGLLIIGESNGNVTGWEWDGKKIQR